MAALNVSCTVNIVNNQEFMLLVERLDDLLASLAEYSDEDWKHVCPVCHAAQGVLDAWKYVKIGVSPVAMHHVRQKPCEAN